MLPERAPSAPLVNPAPESSGQTFHQAAFSSYFQASMLNQQFMRADPYELNPNDSLGSFVFTTSFASGNVTVQGLWLMTAEDRMP